MKYTSDNTFRRFFFSSLCPKWDKHPSQFARLMLWSKLGRGNRVCSYSVGVVATGLRMGVGKSLIGLIGEMALWLKYSTTWLGTSARTHLARAAGDACNKVREQLELLRQLLNIVLICDKEHKGYKVSHLHLEPLVAIMMFFVSDKFLKVRQSKTSIRWHLLCALLCTKSVLSHSQELHQPK